MTVEHMIITMLGSVYQVNFHSAYLITSKVLPFVEDPEIVSGTGEGIAVVD